MISPIGNSVGEAWDNALHCRSGITRVDRFPVEDYRCQVGGEVRDFDVTTLIDRKDAGHLDVYAHYAVGAACEAFADAGLDREGAFEPERSGVMVSSGIGGVDTTCHQMENLLEKGPGRISAFCIPMQLANMASGFLSIKFNFRGPNFSLVSACASGLHSVGESAWIIRRGDADIMMAGGSESGVIALSLAAFGNMRALTSCNDDPAGASRPFDLRRDGFVPAEGAAVLILEELEHARARGVHILGEIAGYGASGDAFHMTAPRPDGSGAAQAMAMALRHAGLPPEAVDYVNAHGTSTPMNDAIETTAIKRALGEHAMHVPVSSTKGVTGHMLGAAGAFESVMCICALRDQIIPPTANYREPDPLCDLDYVPNVARKAKLDVVMNLSLGFGGHNAAVLFRRFNP